MKTKFAACCGAGLSLAVMMTCHAQDMGGGGMSGGSADASSSAEMNMTPALPNAQMQAVLDALDGLGAKPCNTLTPEQARSGPTPADAVKVVEQKMGKPTDSMPVGGIANQTIPGPANNQIPLRIYTPQGNGPFPVLVYYHGGGFVIGTIDAYDASCRELCDMADCVVVSVEYRKAPENKFPAAIDDSYAAYEWVTKNAASIKGDSNKIAVGGESAGGLIAAEVCQLAKNNNAPMPLSQLLIYPMSHYGFDTMSYKVYANAKPLNKDEMVWFWDKYLSTPDSGSDPKASPLDAKDLTGLPPATVITAQIDPLHDDGMMYADKLKAAGVKVMYRNFDGVTHEFFGMGTVVDEAKEAELYAADNLKQCFSK